MIPNQILYFTADWCAPCKVFGPRLHAVAEDLGLTLVKIDADEHRDMVDEFNVMSIPTVIIMSDGAVAGRLTGAQSEAVLRAELISYAN